MVTISKVLSDGLQYRKLRWYHDVERQCLGRHIGLWWDVWLVATISREKILVCDHQSHQTNNNDNNVQLSLSNWPDHDGWCVVVSWSVIIVMFGYTLTWHQPPPTLPMHALHGFLILMIIPKVSSAMRGAARRPPSDAYHGSPLLCLREHLRLVLSTVINQKMWNTTQRKKKPA